jgi:sarcosine oxidase, subunit beta
VTGVGATTADAADAVVVGGGTIGGWCAWFLRRAGLRNVVLLERGVLGIGASSRAAGMVRGQGGTPAAVVLGSWSRDFYRSQRSAGVDSGFDSGFHSGFDSGFDSGFVEQGYYLPAFTEQQVVEARARMAMQQSLGLAVEWLDSAEADRRNPTLAPGCTLGGTFAAGDGYLDPPRNVLAYTVALATSGVEVRERTAFEGLERDPATGAVTGVRTSTGPISTARVVLTGGPGLAEVGRRAGIQVPAGAVMHQVAVTEPHPDLAPDRLPMVFDVAGGIYWRPEDGGLLFGMSNPDEPPGPARRLDQDYLAQVRERLAELVPVTRDLGLRRAWAATIDYTPDHLPIIGPAIDAVGPVDGVTVASAAGHGMMWGPAVSRAAADFALTGTTSMFAGAGIDLEDFSLSRFDEHGRSRLAADPIALPFPERTG